MIFGPKGAIPTSLEFFISWEEMVRNTLYTPKILKRMYDKNNKN